MFAKKPSLECSAGLLFELRHLLALEVFLRVLDRLDRRKPAEFGRFPPHSAGESPEAQNLEERATRKKKKHCAGRPVSRVLDEFPRFHHLATSCG